MRHNCISCGKFMEIDWDDSLRRHIVVFKCWDCSTEIEDAERMDKFWEDIDKEERLRQKKEAKNDNSFMSRV